MVARPEICRYYRKVKRDRRTRQAFLERRIAGAEEGDCHLTHLPAITCVIRMGESQPIQFNN
jgi:hypothetical protein